MTNHEAINVLEVLKEKLGEGEAEALQYAINVLNSSDTDTVSRQAVINAINNLHDKPNAWLDQAVEAVKELPPSPTQSRPAEPPRIPVSERLPEGKQEVLVTKYKETDIGHNCPHNCSYRQSNGYCRLTACINPEYNLSGTYAVGKNGSLMKVSSKLT